MHCVGARPFCLLTMFQLEHDRASRQPPSMATLCLLEVRAKRDSGSHFVFETTGYDGTSLAAVTVDKYDGATWSSLANLPSTLGMTHASCATVRRKCAASC